MTDMPDLVFRRLSAEEMDLASELAESCRLEPTNLESFGLADWGGEGEAWGLFIRGTLAGAARLRLAPLVEAEVTALAVPRKRQGAGIATWILQELAKAAAATNPTTVVHLPSGHEALGHALEEAGFAGPEPKNADYPVGAWRWGA